MEIRIKTDEVSNTLTIADKGMGMTRAEMASNLGTITRSGSRAFVEGMDQAILAEWSKQRDNEDGDEWRWRLGDPPPPSSSSSSSPPSSLPSSPPVAWRRRLRLAVVAAWRMRRGGGSFSAAAV